MRYFISGLKNYAVFKGRSSRKEYWMFELFRVIIIIGFLFVLELLSCPLEIFRVLSIISIGVFVIPSISITVRRLHDTGHPGTVYFVSFIPIVGEFYFLGLLCQKGDMFDNGYGPPTTQAVACKKDVGTVLFS